IAMFEVQIKAWEKKLSELPEDDPGYERLQAHISRLKAHSELQKLSFNDVSFYDASRRPAANDGFPGQTTARIIKSRAVAAADGLSFAEAANQIYGKQIGSLIVKTADPITTSDAAGHVGPAPQDIIELLRVGSVYDQLNLRHVRAHMPIAKITQGTQGYWVAEGSTITASKWTSE